MIRIEQDILYTEGAFPITLVVNTLFILLYRIKKLICNWDSSYVRLFVNVFIMKSENICPNEKRWTISSYRLFILFTLCFSVHSVSSSSDKGPHSLRPKRSSESRHLLPPGWGRFCALRRKRDFQVEIDCLVNKQFSGQWKFNDLIFFLTQQDTKYTFNVRCEDSAAISLYWPMKARNLRGISVENCRIDDYFAGFNQKNNMPDELEYYVFRNNVIMVDVQTLMTVADNAMDQDYDCGNEESVQYFVNRNTTYELLDTSDYNKVIQSYETLQNRKNVMPKAQEDIPLFFSALKMSRSGKKQITQTRAKVSSAEHKCLFTSLSYKEDSPSDNGLLPNDKNSYFPALTIYNVSHSNLRTMPDSMTKWFYHQKNLQLLDASYNNIKKFRFDAHVDVWNVPVLTVNLSHNNITEIKASQIEELVRTKKLFVDFRNNPLNCSCTDTTKQLISLVKDESKWSEPSYQRYKYVRDMQCQFPERLRGRRLLDVANVDLDCEYVVVKKMMVEGIACLGAVVFVVIALLLLVAVLFCCRRSRNKYVWNVNSTEKPSPRFSDPAEAYTVVIPGDKPVPEI